MQQYFASLKQTFKNNQYKIINFVNYPQRYHTNENVSSGQCAHAVSIKLHKYIIAIQH